MTITPTAPRTMRRAMYDLRRAMESDYCTLLMCELRKRRQPEPATGTYWQQMLDCIERAKRGAGVKA